MLFFHNFKQWLKWLFLGELTSEQFIRDLRAKGIRVGENVNFRYPMHTVIDCTRPLLVEIGNDVDINDWFTILTHDFTSFVLRNKYHDFLPSSGRVKIGNNVYFGRNVTILKGVTIGDNCIIGLGSVVTHDIPSNSVACGNPCRVICTLDEYYSKRKKKCVEESFEYAISLRDALNRNLQMSDFTEEWTLFLTEKEYLDNTVMKQHVDFRLKSHKDTFFNSKHEFNGFAEFIEALHNYELEKAE